MLGDDLGCGWEQLEGNAAGNSTDVRLRVAFASSDKHAVERGLAEVEALYCAGPAGGGGIRFHMRPRITATSRLVPRDTIKAKVELHETGHA